MLNASRIITAAYIIIGIISIPFIFLNSAANYGDAWIMVGWICTAVVAVFMIIQGILLYLMMKEKESVAIGVLLIIFGTIPAGIFYLIWNSQQQRIEDSYIKASLNENKPPVSWVCSACGATVQGTYFCSCGHKYLRDVDKENLVFEAKPAAAPHCPSCGMEVSPSDLVCPHCGNSLQK